MENTFVKSFLALMSGSVLTQIITIICSPILTHYFSTEVIGEFTLILTAVGLFGSVICLRYDVAIVSEKEQKRAFCLIKICFIFSILISIVIGIIYFFYYGNKNISDSKRILYSVTIVFLLSLMGIDNTLVSYNNRKKEYKLMAQTLFARTVVREVMIIISAFTFSSIYLLIVAQIFGTICGVKKQSKSLIEDSHNLQDIASIDFNEMKETFFEYRKQAFFSTPSLFINNFSYSSMNYYIDYLFGASCLGLYSISYRLLGMPLSLISGNISKVYLKDISNEYNNNRNYVNTFIKTSILLIVLSVPITICMFIFAPWACRLFFGQEYYQAGIYVRYLAPMFGTRFVVSPLTVGILVSKKQKAEMLVQSLFGISGICIFMYSKLIHVSINNYLLLVSIVYSIIYVIYYCYLYRISKDI